MVLAPHVIPSPLPPQLIYYTCTKAAPVHGVRPSTLSNQLYLITFIVYFVTWIVLNNYNNTTTTNNNNSSWLRVAGVWDLETRTAVLPTWKPKESVLHWSVRHQCRVAMEMCINMTDHYTPLLCRYLTDSVPTPSHPCSITVQLWLQTTTRTQGFWTWCSLCAIWQHNSYCGNRWVLNKSQLCAINSFLLIWMHTHAHTHARTHTHMYTLVPFVQTPRIESSKAKLLKQS